MGNSTMNLRVIAQNGCAAIHLPGRFDFGAHRAFTQAREMALAAGAREIQVNFSGTDYIDSSALGMLLVLRDKANDHGVSVSLAACRGAVADILQVANFGKLFDIRAH